jgi:hypothetical protein
MVEHYCKVNGVSVEQCETDLRQARPPEDWQVTKFGGKAIMDFGPYQELIDGVLERRKQRKLDRWERIVGQKWDPDLSMHRWEEATGRKFDFEVLSAIAPLRWAV